MSSKKKTILMVVVFLVIAAGLLAAYFIWNRSQVQTGVKTITVTVTAPNGYENTHTITTEAEFLRGALDEQKIIEGKTGELGFFIESVDGIQADSAQQQWWCITKNGEDLATGVDITPISDGDVYQLELKEGM